MYAQYVMAEIARRQGLELLRLEFRPAAVDLVTAEPAALRSRTRVRLHLPRRLRLA